jgi:CcmD family protein
MIDQRNFMFMFYGFAAAWVIVTVYVAFLALRERRLREELDRVRRMVEDSGKKI